MKDKKPAKPRSSPRAKSTARSKPPSPERTKEILFAKAYASGLNGAAGIPLVQQCMMASQVVSSEVDWLLPSRIPFGLVTMLTGPSEGGKSTMLGALAAAMSCGVNLGSGEKHVPGAVLVYSPEEDPYHTLRPRWEAQGADLSRIYLGDFGPSGQALTKMVLPADVRKLASMVAAFRIRLVIIDPITAYLASGQATRDDVEVRQLLDALQAIAIQSGCAIIITRHYRKSSDGGPLDRVGGNAAWTQYPRVVLACGLDPEDDNQRVLACAKNNLRHGVPSLNFSIQTVGSAVKLALGKECGVTASAMGLGCSTDADKDAMLDCVNYLRDALKDGEQPAKEVVRTAQESGLSLGTLRRAKVRLKITSHPIGSNSQRYMVWRLPLALPAE
jgi:putative DNA primase/helicase